ncbi:MAG TPA: 3-hydroxyacyl-CoA dehydrogenase NAD-binding domain-containing protein [Anaeromyxobacteraceae bacterium]|nr:3-hydroxyacyl-CoA dehydrogenase NAD-binding domain-containing protein [Anaeromyxobacteraceae bacterium]
MGLVAEADQVAIAGAGPEACLLARLAALGGCVVRLWHASPAVLDAAQERIRAAVEAGLAAGRLSRDDRQRALDGILATTDLVEAVTHADVVVEADAPLPRSRQDLFLRLGESCRASALVATTGASPDELVDWLPQPGRLVGLRLGGADGAGPVEVVASVETSAHALRLACAFVRRLGHEPAVRGGAGERQE